MRNKIKREVPIVLGNISRGIAVPVLAAATIQYALALYHKPAVEVYPLALSAFGLTAALGSVCLSATGPIGSETTPHVLRYAGEKWLHAALLLLQVLILVFARDAMIGWAGQHKWLKTAIT